MGLILASKSQARASLLRQAGVVFETKAASIDESSIKAALQADGATPDIIADTLAEYKAKRVAQNNPNMVLGCDQILVLGDQILSKPATIESAREQLYSLRARSHILISAAVIYEDHQPVWRKTTRAQLFMRAFSDQFIDRYIDACGPDILTSVGAYKIEGAGITLFDRIQGDYHAILGMPLLDILAYLRLKGVLET